ncbi:hypothetical protein AB0K14_21135 [Actinosynnema sp. NPDC050801]|uniref:hypothetical protein n=1 Tax=Actinosynnema sp. NPDC050801 TaxID=3155663 RepID=UPI00343B5163
MIAKGFDDLRVDCKRASQSVYFGGDVEAEFGQRLGGGVDGGGGAGRADGWVRGVYSHVTQVMVDGM